MVNKKIPIFLTNIDMLRTHNVYRPTYFIKLDLSMLTTTCHRPPAISGTEASAAYKVE